MLGSVGGAAGLNQGSDMKGCCVHCGLRRGQGGPEEIDKTQCSLRQKMLGFHQVLAAGMEKSRWFRIHRGPRVRLDGQMGRRDRTR